MFLLVCNPGHHFNIDLINIPNYSQCQTEIPHNGHKHNHEKSWLKWRGFIHCISYLWLSIRIRTEGWQAVSLTLVLQRHEEKWLVPRYRRYHQKWGDWLMTIVLNCDLCVGMLVLWASAPDMQDGWNYWIGCHVCHAWSCLWNSLTYLKSKNETETHITFRRRTCKLQELI